MNEMCYNCKHEEAVHRERGRRVSCRWDECDCIGYVRTIIKSVSNPRQPLLVGQLITMLSLLPQDAIVYTEGCDCTDKAGDVSLRGRWISEESYDAVIITRRKEYIDVEYPDS